jgi:7-keto-8-aminopelargonate synthetase-like enzyme
MGQDSGTGRKEQHGMTALDRQTAGTEKTVRERVHDYYAEVPAEKAAAVQEYLREQDIAYTAVPASVPGMKEPAVHIRINNSADYTEKEIRDLADALQRLTGKHRIPRWNDRTRAAAETEDMERGGYA